MKINIPKIPYDYQQVTYIEAPAAGYIDTLYIPDYANGFRIEMDFELSTLGVRYGLLSNYNQGTSQLSLEIATTNKIRLWLNGGNVDSNNTTVINQGSLTACVQGRNQVAFGYENQVCYVECNGSRAYGTYTTTIQPATTSMYLYLDRALRSGTFTKAFKVYSCRVITQGQITLDLIPCYRKSDNKMGMYDLATHRFLPQAGSGTFTKGSNNTIITKTSVDLGKRLPLTYKELDYVECDGNQYIALDKPFTSQNIDIEIEADPSFTKQERCIVGASSTLEFGWSSTENRFISWTTSLGSVSITNALVYERNIFKLHQDSNGRTLSIQNLSSSDDKVAPISNADVFLFSLSSSTSYRFKGKFYKAVLKNNNIIVRYLIPCKRVSDSKIGIYDLQNDVFYVSSGSDLIAGNEINPLQKCSPKTPESLLPQSYQRVEYISSSGSSYIDTGLPVHMNWKYEIDFQQNTASTFRSWGAFNQSSYSGQNCSLTYVSSQFALRWESRTNQSTSQGFGINVNTNRHKLIVDNGVSTFDGTTFAATAGHNSSFTTSYNAYLFTINPGGTTPTTNLNGKIYSYKVWDNNGIFKQYLIPCYRKSDNVIGMYDIINKQFLTNIGTGTFTKGGNI